MPSHTFQELAHDGKVSVGESMFPAKVHMPDGTTHSKVKVWVVSATHLEGTNWVLVVANTALEVIDVLRVVPKDFSTATRVYETAAGELTYYKDGGCGCGQRLRSWNPWKTGNRLVAVTNPRRSMVA